MSENGSARAVSGMSDSAADTEQNKRKLEEDTQKSETSNNDAKKLRTSDNGEAPAREKCKSDEVESVDTPNAKDSVTEVVGKNETGVSGREAEVKEEELAALRLAVVLEGFPGVKMTEEQAEKVETVLAGCIDPTDEGDPIQFSETEYENGALVFTCANRATKLWLYRTARKLVPWPGAKLTVGHAETTLKGTRLVLWLVHGMHKRSNERVFDLLQKQNKDLSTTEWKVVSRVEEADEKVRLTVWVDDKSAVDLKARNFKFFLGLTQSTFMPVWEWNKLKKSLTVQRDTQLAPPNPRERPSNYAPQKPAPTWQQKPASPWMRKPAPLLSQKPTPLLSLYPEKSVSPWTQNPVSPWIVPPWLASHGLLDSSVHSSSSLAAHQSRALGLSDPDLSYPISRYEDRGWLQSHELELADTDPALFRKAQFTSSDPLSPRERTYTESAVLRSLEPGFLASEKTKESRYTSDRPQDSRYLASDRRHRHETEYGDKDALLLRNTRFTVSDRAQSRDSKYVTPNRDQLESLSSGSRFSDPGEPLKETVVLQNLRSTFSTSEQPRERGFSTSELSHLKETDYGVSDRARRREPRYTSDRPQDDRYFTDRHRSLETDYRSPDSLQLRETSYTALDRALRREPVSVTVNRDKFRDSTLETADRDKSRHSRCVHRNRDRSENSRFRGSGQSPSRVSRSGDLDEPRSERPRERGIEMSELSHSRETGYTSDRAQHRECRHTSRRHKDRKYSSSERRHSRERDYRALDPPKIRGTSYTDSDRQRSRSSKSVTPVRDKFRDSTSATTNRRKSRDSRYVSPNRDKNSKFRGSDQSPPRVSKFNYLDAPLAETAVLQNLASTLLTSERHRERGFDTSELLLSRETSYLVSDRAQRSESRYTSDRQQDKYLTSDRHQPRATGFEALSRNSQSVAASRDRDSRYVPPTRDQSENWMLVGDSRLRNLNELPVWESSLRHSDKVQSREGRLEQRDPLYSNESLLRLSDPQLLRDFDNTVSRLPHSREDRLSGPDISPWQSRSSYVTSEHSHFSRAVDSRRNK